MLSLLFEVLPKPGQEAAYFEMAAKLRPSLDASGGLLFLDRSRSEARPGWFLSHQYWLDEASMARWRANDAHHRAQACGRADILADYRLRVGQVIAEVDLEGRVRRIKLDPQYLYDQRPARPHRLLVTTASRQRPAGLPSSALIFSSVYEEGLEITVIEVESILDGETILAWLTTSPGILMARLSLVSRDYGMFDRAEAPQYFEPAATLA